MTIRLAKRADYGSDGQSRSFESAFAQIAHDYLQDRAPALLDYEVGFQLLDRDDDKNRSLGVTAFKVGEMWLYAPVFYVNGKLKGEELLYIKDKDMFAPLDDSWVDALLRKAPMQVGKSVPFNTYDQGVRLPDLMDIGMSPRKFASVMPHLEPWAADAAATVVKAALDPISPESGLLGHLARRGVKAASAWASILSEWPHLKRGFDTLYTPEEVQGALEKAARPRRVRGPKRVMPRKLKLDPAPATAKVAAIKLGQPLPIGLDDSDREALLRDGLLIKDARVDGEVSNAYVIPVRTDLDKSLRSPSEAGLYDVLDRDAKVVKCFVFPAPVSDRSIHGLLVVPVEGAKKRDWVVAHSTRIYVSKQYPDEDFRKALTKLPKVGDLNERDLAAVIDVEAPGGATASLPFEAGPKRGGRDGVTTRSAYFRACCLDTTPAFGPLPRPRVEHTEDRNRYRESRVRTGLPEGSRLQVVDDVLRVPKTARKLVLKAHDDVMDWESDRDRERFELGDMAEVALGIRKMGTDLTVAGKPGDRSINGQFIGRDQGAVCALVLDHGLREKEAHALLKTAADEARFGRGATFLVKYADGYPRFGDDPTAPQFPEPNYADGSAMHPQQRTLPFQERLQPVESARSRPDARSAYGPITDQPEPDQAMLQAAARASEEGDREFFDTAGLQSLLRVVATDDLLDDDLDAITLGMDAMGRQLMKMYFHDEQYVDRYGESGAQELEDAFRNTFEATGKLVISARQQTIEPMPEEAARSADLGSVANQ